MNLKNHNEIEKIIKSVVIKIIKLYKGKGPDYVNVKITGKEIEICAKGILSSFGKFLIEHDGIEVVELARKKAQSILYKYMIDEILKETNLKCEVIYEECNFIEDFRKLILKIEK